MLKLLLIAPFVVAISLLSLGNAVAQDATPGAVEAFESFILVEEAVDVTDIDLGDPGPSTGDLRVWGPDPMFDPDTSEDTGATTQGTCVSLDETGLCLLSETIVFPDGSTLHLQGVQAAGSDPSTRTIVAGSGRFLGAVGTVQVAPSPDLTTWTKTFQVEVD